MPDNDKNKPRVVTRKSTDVKSGFVVAHEMMPTFSNNGTKQPKYIDDYRDKAWQAFENLDMPSTSDEAWRRTDISKLNPSSFIIKSIKPGNDLTDFPPDVNSTHNDEELGGSILLSPGEANVRLNEELSGKGVIFTDLATAALQNSDILEKILGKLVDVGEGKFAAMAGAFAGQGVLLYVPAGVSIEQTLHSKLWAPGDGIAHFSHILIWLEDGASATYIHEYQSPNEDNASMHAGIVEVNVGKGANLKFTELQSWGKNVWNFAHKRARVEKDANFEWVVGALGSHLTKDFSEIDLVGEGSEGRMSGLYFTNQNQHFDYDTQQNHLAPNTSSDLLFKGALTGKSRAVWQGMIYVAKDAQKTDGYQSNPNLVLSKEARADSIPGLEILADDVRCTHGATVGKIDPEEIFYLQSRGISDSDAESIIVEGFFDPIVQKIPVTSIRDRFARAILDKLN